uniref:CSON009778 protein n=1 Tax=Culicoides sonorensis TaxID=179676 RepID=A0A336M1G7_CULSO
MAAIPASNLPTTRSLQRLISHTLDEEEYQEDVVLPRHTTSNQVDTISLTFMNVPRKHVFTVAVLCFINLINYMDRFTIAGVLTNLQTEFNIDDSLAGLLQTVFIISYMVFAPIFGYLGDRYSRRKIMGCGITLWCATTLLGSFMPNYHWFVVFRALVGIGEASYSTIAPTIISDLFIKDLRSKFLAIFYFAIPVGSGLGYIIGSETANALNDWRFALRVTPLLGAIAVILLYFSCEPERGEAEGSHHMQATSYKEDLRALCKNPSFMLSTAGFTCVAFVAGALAWWGPTFMYLGVKSIGNNDITLNDVSYRFGIVAMLAGLVGVPLGSYIAQKYRPTMPNCDPLICALGLLISSPMVYFGMILADVSLAWTLFFVFLAEVSLNLTWSLVADILLYVVIPTRRSTAEAFQILLSHALGDAGSPYLVGVISDAVKFAMKIVPAGLSINFYRHSQNTFYDDADNDLINFKSLQYSLFSACFVEVIGAVFFLFTSNYIMRDKSRAERAIQENQINEPSEESDPQALPVAPLPPNFDPDAHPETGK